MATKTELENQTERLEKQIAQLKIQVEQSEKQIKQLEKQIEFITEEKRYLAQAVDAKDKEISSLIKQADKSEIAAELQNSKAADERSKGRIRDLESRIEELEQIEKRRVEELNNYIFMHGALIKTIQGVLESASLLNDKVTKEVME